MTPQRIREALREPIRVLFKLVGIPLICLTPLFFAALYMIGGTDLIRFALAQLTWKMSLMIVSGIGVLALLAWLRHMAWYQDEPPPMWWRRSSWVNLVEILVLLGLVFLGIWAIPRFA